MSRALFERLARVRALLPTDDPEGQWFGAALDRFLVGAAKSLDEALALNSRGTPARVLEMKRVRDGMIADFALTFCGAEKGGAAKAVAGKLNDYRYRAWCREQRAGGPSSCANPEALALFAIFKHADGDVPECQKQISRILNRGHPVAPRMSVAV